MKRTPVALVLALMLLLLVGCTLTTAPPAATSTPASASTPTATSTASKACQFVLTINQALTALYGIGDNTTVGEVKTAQQKLTNALNSLTSLIGSENATLNDLKASNEQLAAQIQDLPDSATVGEVSTKLQDFKTNVAKAQGIATRLTALLKCTG